MSSESLKTALETLATFRAELPDFERLVKDNEAAAETLRRERADLSKQAEAKGRVSVAREMLEQHHSDIATAQAEVSRLEAEASRASTLQTMADHAKQAQELRTAYDREMKAAVTQLEKRLETIRGIKAGLASAREGFYAAGQSLAPEGFGIFRESRTVSLKERALLNQDAAPVLDELRAAGVDLTYVLTAYNPSKTYKLDQARSPHKIHVSGPVAFFIDEQTGL